VKTDGHDGPDVAFATASVGRAQLAAGDAHAARTTLIAAIAALEKIGSEPRMLARTRITFADAAWQLGDKAAALASVAKAETELAAAKQVRVELVTWRAAHAR
jgi:hypothetical protein